jgi:thiol-disulfide isomerase/thioredoxin
MKSMTMPPTKSIILLCVSMLFLFSCKPQEGEQTVEQPKHRYKIIATVKDCEGCQVMMRSLAHRKMERIDSTVVKDGSFVLKGLIPDSGFYTVDVRYPGAFVTSTIYLPTDSVHITVNHKNPLRPAYFPRAFGSSRYNLVFSTSSFQQEAEKYTWKRDSLWNKFYDDRDLVLAKFQKTYDSGNPALVQLWADSLENFGNRFANYMSYATDLFIREGASPEAAIFAMMDSRNDRMASDRFKAYLAALPEEHRQSPQGRYLESYLQENEQRNKNNQRFVNSRIRNLDLKGSTPEGIELDESEIFKKNKLTLVEFWASWCGPCRMAMPKYYELYGQYKDKGMGFIAVSLDNRREMWLKAVEQDGFNIHHVSELKGAKGEDMKRFEIKGIPANMLVDDKGVIVAVDISKVDLKNKLKESL